MYLSAYKKLMPGSLYFFHNNSFNEYTNYQLLEIEAIGSNDPIAADFSLTLTQEEIALFNETEIPILYLGTHRWHWVSANEPYDPLTYEHRFLMFKKLFYLSSVTPRWSDGFWTLLPLTLNEG